MANTARLLIVDDDPEIREQLSFAFRDAGFEVDVAGTAADARVRLGAGGYDVVIADWWLSDSDGLVLANEAAAHGAKTFVLTGYALTLLGEAAERHGMIRKPVSPVALVETVCRALADAEAAPGR